MEGAAAAAAAATMNRAFHQARTGWWCACAAVTRALLPLLQQHRSAGLRITVHSLPAKAKHLVLGFLIMSKHSYIYNDSTQHLEPPSCVIGM
jgi:hypothetical protein